MNYFIESKLLISEMLQNSFITKCATAIVKRRNNMIRYGM